MRVHIKQFSRYMTRNSSCFVLLHRRFYADKRSSFNHYHILGVNSNASSKEIKAAFYRLSKKYHPDVNTDDPQAASKFNTISNAYDILNDPIKRREYDQELQSLSSNPDPFVTYTRTSQYAQRARAHRASARQTTYSSNGFNGGFHRNSRSTNHESYHPNFDQTSDSDNKNPVNEEFEEKSTRIVIPKVFLFSLFLTFSLAAYVTSNLLRTMHFQQPLEEFPSRLVPISQSTRKSSIKI